MLILYTAWFLFMLPFYMLKVLLYITVAFKCAIEINFDLALICVIDSFQMLVNRES